MTARRWFHVLLGAIFIPLVTLPLAWGVAIYGLRRAADVEARRWAKRMLGLALVDTLAVIVGAVLVAQQMEASEPPASAAEDRVVIGVSPDFSFSGPGARVEHVFPGGPATAAGLEPGDVITRVAGEEISGHEALRDAVGELEPGVAVSLELKRGPSTIAVSITPRWSSEMPRTPPGLFDPVESDLACFPRPNAPGLVALVLVLAATVVLATLVTRRGSVSGARGVWWTGLSLVSASVAGYLVPAGACVVLGGQTAAGQVFVPWGSSLALAGTALVGRRFVGGGPASTPTRTCGSAVALGAWYIIAGAARLAVFVAAAMLLVPGPAAAGSHPVESLARGVATAQGPGLLLLAVPIVLFAPVGEELAFRGLLQPALSTWVKPAAAVALTSMLFTSMHWYYGLKLPLFVLFAAVLGWARVVTGGVRASIVLHMLVNAVGLVPIFLEAWRGG